MKLIDAFRQRDYPVRPPGKLRLPDAWCENINSIRDHNRRARFLQGLLWFLLMAAGMLVAFWPQAKTEAPSHESNQEPKMPKQNNNPRAALGWTSFESTRVLFARREVPNG